jgi:hypothetical protein
MHRDTPMAIERMQFCWQPLSKAIKAMCATANPEDQQDRFATLHPIQSFLIAP